MDRYGPAGSFMVQTVAVLLLWACLSCAPPTQSPGISPAATRWPDPAFSADRQCRGGYAVEDLQRYLPRARVALWLPGTQSVDLDQARQCITLSVESVGGGRLAELVVRGVAVPRRAVLLTLSTSR
jgi:hypothetical protein